MSLSATFDTFLGKVSKNLGREISAPMTQLLKESYFLGARDGVSQLTASEDKVGTVLDMMIEHVQVVQKSKDLIAAIDANK